MHLNTRTLDYIQLFCRNEVEKKDEDTNDAKILIGSLNTSKLNLIRYQ